MAWEWHEGTSACDRRAAAFSGFSFSHAVRRGARRSHRLLSASGRLPPDNGRGWPGGNRRGLCGCPLSSFRLFPSPRIGSGRFFHAFPEKARGGGVPPLRPPLCGAWPVRHHFRHRPFFPGTARFLPATDFWKGITPPFPSTRVPAWWSSFSCPPLSSIRASPFISCYACAVAVPGKSDPAALYSSAGGRTAPVSAAAGSGAFPSSGFFSRPDFTRAVSDFFQPPANAAR